MAEALILGIDIGVEGAIALLHRGGKLISVHDMPILKDGPRGRSAINAPLLYGIIANSLAGSAFVESVNARPGEGAVGAFAFGRARGVVEGILAATGLPCTFLTPPAWKRAVGLTLASKDASRAEAIRRWPDRAEWFARVRDDGRAEAALIAVAGMLKK